MVNTRRCHTADFVPSSTAISTRYLEDINILSCGHMVSPMTSLDRSSREHECNNGKVLPDDRNGGGVTTCCAIEGSYSRLQFFGTFGT